MAGKITDIWMRRATLLVLLTGAAIFAAWMLCARGTGLGWMDDYAYSLNCVPQHVKIDSDFFFPQKCDSIDSPADSFRSAWWHLQVVNARLGNVLMFFYWHLPVWVAIVLQGLFYAAFIVGIMQLSAGSQWRRRPLALVLVIMSVWVVLPWNEMYASADFVINYVWSGAGCVWSLWAVINSKSKLRWLWLVIPASLMHEGLSAATDAGMLVHVLLHRREYFSHPRRLVLPLAFGLCSLFTLLAPITWTNSAARDWDNITSEFVVRGFLLPNVIMLAICALYAVQCVRGKRYRHSAVLLTVMLASVAIGFISVQMGRTLWMACTVAVVMLAQMSAHIRLRRGVTLALASVALALLSYWGYRVCALQWRATCEKQAVIEELRRGHPEGLYVLQHVTNFKEEPWWMFSVPEVLLNFTDYQQYVVLKQAVGERCSDSRGNFAVLPPARTLEESVASMPMFPSGLRGDLNGFISRQRARKGGIMMYFESEGDLSVPGWPPVYKLKKYYEPIPRLVYCLEIELRTQGGEVLWYYRPYGLPRSLYGRRLLNAYVCE